jgi:hypothetical protein
MIRVAQAGATCTGLPFLVQKNITILEYIIVSLPNAQNKNRCDIDKIHGMLKIKYMLSLRR